MPKSKQSKTQLRGIPRSEWVAAGIGAALVLASIAILVHSAATSNNSPPRLTLRVASISKSNEQFLVTIEVGNDGDSTAADARIEAELRSGGAVVERGETTVDFVPPGSKRRAGILFHRDPKTLELTLHASGYREP